MKKLRLHIILKRLIEDRGVSAREVSRACKIPQATLSAYMAGRGSHRLEHISCLAQHFEVSMEYLLFGEDRKLPSLSDVLTEKIYDGWIKIRVERAVPNKRIADDPEE